MIGVRRRRFTALVWLFMAATAWVAAGQKPEVWNTVATLAAPEAHQAAAADKRFIYAINNTTVAKYDRQTNRLAAVSVGDAQHLNSGFLWNGQLFCAHSNYPRTPERSEIKVLDLKSMQLSTFHDFGNFGGSLTWAVRHDGHWWCNFAKYGAETSKTFLVKMTDQWEERARWTYPPEVIAAMGRYSLSGGLWWDEFLMVTDHDRPVLYRLRVPSSGRELKLVDKQTVPFTGQGIAVDPKTGGLVGINRAKRQIVMAVGEAAGKQ